MSYKYFLFISLIFCNLSYGQIRPTLIPVQRDTLAPSLSPPPLAFSPTKDTLSIVAVGDVMIGSAFPLGYLPKDDAIESFKQVKPYLKGDIVFGNLEGAILDEGDSDKCKDKEEGSCYAFRMPDRYGTILKEAGFNLMSTANNHANDFGEKGRLNTARVLNEVGI